MREHYLAITKRLSALKRGQVRVPVCLGDPLEDEVAPYAFVTANPSVGVPLNAAGTDTTISQHFTVTFVDISAGNVLALAEAGDALLNGFTPNSEGWRTFPLRLVDSQPIKTDSTLSNGTTDTYIVWTSLQYHLQATKE